MRRCRAALLLALLAPVTSGCIAAVVPLAAGAALVNRPDLRARAAKLDAAAEAASRPAGSDRAEGRIVRTSLTALPPPDAQIAALGVPSFRSYALAQAQLVPGAGKRESAIIPDASDLRLVRGDCGSQQSAVFIDLDPGRGTFDPLEPGVADAALAAALAELRAHKVRVVWFSRLGASFAPAARKALAEGGLDPAATDELMLLDDIDQRKQTLRDETAKRLCPIAIVGDERADFDELYLYLKNPDAALALDGMIGRGWFLASPYTQAAKPEPGATP